MWSIDIDFQDDRREEVIEYVRRKYGEECVSNIITYGNMKSKSAIRDVARIYDHEPSFGDRIAKLVPDGVKNLKQALDESEEFRNMYNSNSDIKAVVDTAITIEGLPKSTGKHACFDENTLITTDKGLKRIVDINIGDNVLTHKRRFKPVVDLIETHTETVYTIKATASAPVKVTGNHPFYVREMSIQRLRKYKDGIESSRKVYSEPKWKDASELRVGKDYIGIPINNKSIIPKYNNIKLPFDNNDFWWILGRYIGDDWTEVAKRKRVDGSFREDKRVVICCNHLTFDEVSEIENKLISVGFSYRIEKSRTTYKIYINDNKELFDYLLSFGKYAHGKHLNSDILNLPLDMAKSFVEGYIGADGSYNKKTGRYSFKTVSYNLAIGLMQLINKVYLRPVTFAVLPEKEEQIEGRTVLSKEKYEMHFTIDARQRDKSFYEDGFIWTRVSSIESIHKSQSMYNLTVLDDSSYVAHGLCVHNCGVIIAPDAITNFIPQVVVLDETGEKDSKGSKIFEPVMVTQLDMAECEELGLLKMDFLGLRNLSVIAGALNLINKKRLLEGLEPLIMDDIPITDPYAFKHIQQGNTVGVFQLESGGMTNLVSETYPDIDNYIREYVQDKKVNEKGIGVFDERFDALFERLIALISLYRPGPMDEIPNYLNNMNNPDDVKYDAPQLKDILSNTYGIIVYQEQVMHAVRQMAGFSAGQSDIIRKAMGKICPTC